MEKVEGVTRIGDMTWTQTKSERHFDLLLQERRLKGRQTYGQGLEHTDNYDWNQMALEEAMDLAQYLAAENLRLRELLEKKPMERDAIAEVLHDLIVR